MTEFGTKNALFGYFWPKMPYLGIFGQELKKKYCQIWNQHPQIFLIAKFRGKTKMPKFGTTNALFGYFWAGIWKQNCHISKQHPQICLIVKFREIMKMPKYGNKNVLFVYFWPRMSYLGAFGLEFEKNIVIFEISVLEFILLQSLIRK